MTDTELGSRTSRVQVTMIELQGGQRNLRAVQGQLAALEAIMAYGEVATNDVRFTMLPSGELGVRAFPGMLPAGATTHVEWLTMTSPMKVVLFVSNRIGTLLFGIVNAYNDMRVKHGEAKPKVDEEKLTQDLIKLLRGQMATISDSERGPIVEKAAQRIVERAAEALHHVASFEELPAA